MGADLILQSGYVGDGFNPPPLDVLAQQARDMIPNATEDQWADAYESWEGEEPDDDYPVWRDDIRQRAEQAVQRLFDDDAGLPRDATFMRFHKRWYLLTGGTSWGDSFEAMDDLSILLALGCFHDFA